MGSPQARVVGRYALCGEIAAGGMATVHVGRLLGAAGFARVVAIKRLHAQFAKDREFVSMFIDEARLSSRIRHPNVVSVLDVVASEGELLLVMDYVQGESLASLLRTMGARQALIPHGIVSRVMLDVLNGLHAAHEAVSERGEPLCVVHRDVSPQNILIGSDGITRVLDFGVAKAAGCSHVTRQGQIKGKVPYMSPEQLLGEPVDRRTDVYAASVVLWFALTGRNPFHGDDAAIMRQVLDVPVPAPSAVVASNSAEVDTLVMRGLSRPPDQRFATARAMAETLERVLPPSPIHEVAAWVCSMAAPTLSARAKLVAEIESSPGIQSDASGTDSPPDGTLAPTEALTIAAGARGSAKFSRRRWARIALLAGAVAAVGGAALLVAKIRAVGSVVTPTSAEKDAPAQTLPIESGKPDVSRVGENVSRPRGDASGGARVKSRGRARNEAPSRRPSSPRPASPPSEARDYGF